MKVPSHDTPSRRTGRGQRTRQRILEVAETLIARHGVAGFELKDVAAEVGIRSPSIFAHFRGRDDLATAVAREVGKALMAQLVVDLGADPEQALRTAVKSLVAHLAEHPAHVRVLLADLSQRKRLSASGAAKELRRAEGRLRTLLEAGIASGRFRRIDTESFVSFMLGGILASMATRGADPGKLRRSDATLSRLRDNAEEIAVRSIRLLREE